MRTICTCRQTSYDPTTTWIVNGLNIVRCSDCGVRRVLDPAPDSMTQYASGQYHAEGSADLTHEVAGRDAHKERFTADLEVARVRIEALSKYITRDRPHRLIDVGCANGAVLAAAEDVGYLPEGVDLSDKALAIDDHIKVRIGDLREVGFPRRYADVVMFNDSIEHFTDPVSALKAAGGILKRDGILVVDTPDMGSAEAVEAGPRFHHVKPHEHLWYFTAGQLRDLLESQGFTVLGMEVPVAGKVTAYASPKVAVTDVKIFGPSGIGDIMWTIHKWAGIRRREWPCRMEYVVCMRGPKDLTHRARDYVLLSRYIDSFSVEPRDLPPDNGCPDPALPHYNLFANDFVDPKTPPYVGQSLELWRPELESDRSDWGGGIDIPEACYDQGFLRVSTKYDNYACIYMSSHIYNASHLEPAWTKYDWAQLCVRLKAAGITPVLIGAYWDSQFADAVAVELDTMGYKASDVWVNLIGRTPFPLTMAIAAYATHVIGAAAGVTLVPARDGVPTTLFWPIHGRSTTVKVCERPEYGWTPEFPEAWLPPMYTYKDFHHLTTGEFDVDTVIDIVTRNADTATSAK